MTFGSHLRLTGLMVVVCALSHGFLSMCCTASSLLHSATEGVHCGATLATYGPDNDMHRSLQWQRNPFARPVYCLILHACDVWSGCRDAQAGGNPDQADCCFFCTQQSPHCREEAVDGEQLHADCRLCQVVALLQPGVHCHRKQALLGVVSEAWLTVSGLSAGLPCRAGVRQW